MCLHLTNILRIYIFTMFGFLFKPIKIVFGVFKLIVNVGKGLLKILEGVGQEMWQGPEYF